MGCTSTAGTAQDWKIGEFDRAPLLHEKTFCLSLTHNLYIDGDEVLIVYPDYAIAMNLNLKSWSP